MTTNTILADPRRRNLLVLAAIAFVAVLAAVLALRLQAAETAPRYTPHAFLPGFAAQVRHAARIRIADKNGTVDIVFKPMQGWVLPARGDYPADFAMVKKTLVGLAALETIAPETARPGWFKYIHVDAPPKGQGTLLTVTGDHGRTLASLIVGKSEDTGGDNGETALYVRKPGNTQSWLVKSVFTPATALSDWMEKDILAIDATRIASADVEPPGSAPYRLSRDKPADAGFTLSPVPKGRSVADPAGLAAVADALTDFSFEDVQPAKNLDFEGTDAAHLTVHTFDGLIVRADVVKAKGSWVRIEADSVPANPAAARQAREINARAAGWAYKLPDEKGSEFMTTRDSLLAPLPAKAGKGK